jgi:murein DD-endopeptidase MepM/ murein hydrolase activator NlpD
MKHRRILLVLFLVLGITAAACSGLPVELVATTIATASLVPSPTIANTHLHTFTVTSLPSLTSAPQQTPSPTIPSPTLPTSCDPAGGFCIEAGHFLLDRPIALPGTITVDPTYTYGTTQSGQRDPHHGVEFYNASGTPVLAAADGLVAVAGKDDQVIYGLTPNTYGNLIVLEHHFPGIDQTVYTLYGHLSIIDVKVSQTVQAGEQIGEVGSSGAAIGSHLHFEVRLGQNNYDSNRNPVLWLKPLKGGNGIFFGTLAGRLQDAQGNLIYTRSLNVQYYPNPPGPPAAAYPVETYAAETHPVQRDDRWKENFALGDLAAGSYRLSFIWSGKLLEDWVNVQPGQVTVVTFVVK